MQRFALAVGMSVGLASIVLADMDAGSPARTDDAAVEVGYRSEPAGTLTEADGAPAKRNPYTGRIAPADSGRYFHGQQVPRLFSLGDDGVYAR